MGEISFCAYNTGVGWRHIVEKMHQNATVAEWYKKHGQARRVRESRARRVPLPAAQPVTLKIPRDGVLVDYAARNTTHTTPTPTAPPTPAIAGS